MTIRIWHQSAAPFGALGKYRDALVAHVQTIVSQDTHVDFHGLDPALYAGRAPADALKYAYPRHLIVGHIIENCIRAERASYDAVAIASFNDPYVREARSIVDIPVVSMAESSLLIGCSVAKRIALITLTAENVWRLREIVDRHSLERRISGIYALEPKTNERELLDAFENFDLVREPFIRIGQRAVSEGAELLVAAEGVLNEVLFAHRFHRIDSTPVLDCIGVTFLHAEMMVKLRSRSGLEIGRIWDHAKPDADFVSALRKANRLDDPS